MLELAVFYALFGALLLSKTHRQKLQHKSVFEWVTDSINLLIQGVGIPVLRASVLVVVLQQIFPAWQGIWRMPDWAGFGLNMLVVDYLYYWNHRLMHLRPLFPIHMVHHSVRFMDVMATSRNSLWTSLFFVYLWINGLLLFLTDFNAGFMLGMSLTAALDLWKHSPFLAQQPRWLDTIAKYLCVMTPQEHAWHHSSQLNFNYGANWNLFDKLHGTYRHHDHYPEKLGVTSKLSPWQQFFLPFARVPHR